MLIVLAEDDDALRGALAVALRADGHRVVEARDGQELVDRIEDVLRAPRRPPAAVVTDVCMPGLSGLDVLCVLRCARCPLPTILTTGLADDETRADALAIGALGVLQKPFELDALRALLAAAVSEEARP